MRYRWPICMMIILLLLNRQARAQQYVEKPVAILPFKYDGVHIVIRCNISPYPDTLNFIFDSGSEINVLDEKRVENWRIKSDKAAGVSGLCKGMTYQEIVDAVELNLGHAHIGSPSFYVEDLSDLHIANQPVDGIIGYQLLKNFTVKIDYIHHTLSLYNPGKFIYSSRGEILPIDMNFFTPTVKASLPFTSGSTLEGVYHITTGGDYGVLFNYPYVKKYKIDKVLPMTGESSVEDMLKTVEYYNGVAVAITLGKYHLRNVPCSYSPDVDDGNPNKEIAGAIGNSVWKNFTIILNLSEKQMYLEPNHPFSK